MTHHLVQPCDPFIPSLSVLRTWHYEFVHLSTLFNIAIIKLEMVDIFRVLANDVHRHAGIRFNYPMCIKCV